MSRLADSAALPTIDGWGLARVEVFHFPMFVTAMDKTHHSRPGLVGEGVRLEVRFDAGRQRELLDAVDGGAGHDRSAGQLLEAQHWGEHRNVS